MTIRLRGIAVAVALGAALPVLPVFGPATSSVAMAAISPQTAATSIEDFGNKAISALSEPGLDRETRTERFRNLFHEGFDFDWISRFVLGRHWRTASEPQREAFRDAFDAYVVATYSSRFADYIADTYSKQLAASGESKAFKTTNVRADSNDDRMVVISGQIWRPDGPPVPLDFRVRVDGNSPQIIDIAIEGVSMAITQRSEFSSVIERSGMDGLISELKRRTGQVTASAR